MANGDYKNNPLYTDITQLDHLSPAPVFQYFWNKESGRWEPQRENRTKCRKFRLRFRNRFNINKCHFKWYC